MKANSPFLILRWLHHLTFLFLIIGTRTFWLGRWLEHKLLTPLCLSRMVRVPVLMVLMRNSTSFFWKDINDRLFEAIRHFFRTFSMPKSWAHTYILLIPKIGKTRKGFYYRPISLCNVCYKIVTEILANRLKEILPNLIIREQSGFVHAWNPLDNILAI